MTRRMVYIGLKFGATFLTTGLKIFYTTWYGNVQAIKLIQISDSGYLKHWDILERQMHN
jgi:hypothetical protein